MSSELFGTFDYCVGPSELGMDVLSAYQVVGHTILVIYRVRAVFTPVFESRL